MNKKLTKQLYDLLVVQAAAQDFFVAPKQYSTLVTICCTQRDYVTICKVSDFLLAQDIVLDDTSLVLLLKQHASHKNLDRVLKIFSHQQVGNVLNSIVYNVMLKICIQFRAFEKAETIHEQMKRDKVQLTVMLATTLISMYSNNNQLEKSMDLYSMMRTSTVAPDAVTCTVLITACTAMRVFITADQVWSEAQQAGTLSTELVSSVIKMYCQSDRLERALELHGRIRELQLEPSAVTYTVMIAGCLTSCEFATADRLWKEAQTLQNLSIELVNTVLTMYCRSSRLEQALELHRKMREIQLEPDDVTYTVLISGCNLYNNYKAGMHVIELLQNANVQMTPNLLHTLIAFYMNSDNNAKAFDLFDKYSRIIPFTLNVFKTLLSDCSSGAFVDTMERQIVNGEFENPLNTSILILCYAYRGEYDKCEEVFEQSQTRDSNMYEALLYTYAIQGNGQRAVHTLREMLALGETPTEKSYTSVLSACSHRYMVEEAKQVVAELKKKNQYTEILQVCMVDALSRAGELEEAISVAREIKGNAFIAWKAVLAGCKQYNDIQRSVYVSQQLQKYAPNDTSTHVLMANIYATAGMTEERDAIRRMIDERGLKKIPGVSYVKLGKEYRRFYVEDKNVLKEAVEYLDHLRKVIIEKYKYIPDTSCVLRDFTTEEERITHLWRHTEKLALATALLHHSDEVFITKNLRMCLDCHTATKMISKHTKRTLKIKDVSRLHTMTDGVCDCGDRY